MSYLTVINLYTFYTSSQEKPFNMEKLEVCDVKTKVCGICGEESAGLFYITPDGSEYKDARMCMLYEVLCTRQGFFLCESCKNLTCSCSEKIMEVCQSRRLYSMTHKRGCFFCGVDRNTRVFKTMNKELEEKVLRRFKRQHQFKTVYTDTICNTCKLMFTELVKLQTILHDNIENCELKAPQKHPILKSKKVLPVGNGCTTESTANESETVTFSEPTTSHDNQAKEIRSEAIDKGLTKKIRVPSAKPTPSNKLPANKVLFRSMSNLEDRRTRRVTNAVDDRTGKCSGDVARKRVSFKDPLGSASPPPSSPKLTETTLKSILKKGRTFETQLPHQGIRIPIDFSKLPNYRAPCLLNLMKLTHRPPRFYNPTDLPSRRRSESKHRQPSDSCSQPSLLDARMQVFDLSNTGECSYISPTVSVVSEDEDDKAVPQMTNCLPDTKGSEQLAPTLSKISQTDEQVEVGDTALPPITDTVNIEEVVDNDTELGIPANQVMDDGLDFPKTTSDFSCDVMINELSQLSSEEDYSESDSGSLVSVLNVETHYLSDDELSITSEDDVKYMDKVVPQAADCLPDKKESEQITPPALSIISQSDEQVEVGYTTLPPITDTIDRNDTEEVVDNITNLRIPANQIIGDGIDWPKTASDIMNQPSQFSREEDYSKIDEDFYYENFIENDQ